MTTRGDLWSNEMAAHTITPSPPHRLCWCMQQAAYLSPGRRHTLSRRSRVYTQNLDSSEKRTPLHWIWVQFWCILAQLRRFCCLSGVRSVTIAGERALRLTWWSLRRTVLALIRGWRIPGVSATVCVEVRNLSRRCWVTIYWSCSGVVTFSRPGRGLSSTESVSRYRCIAWIQWMVSSGNGAPPGVLTAQPAACPLPGSFQHSITSSWLPGDNWFI